MPLGINFGKLFRKNGIAEQILVWQVLGQVLGAMLGPLTNEISRAVNEISQTTPLTPSQLADMVVRNIVAKDDATAYAKQSGIAPSDFDRMTAAAGEGPAVGELVVALRRQLIPETGKGAESTSFEQGIAESHLRNKWTDLMKHLATEWPTPNDALQAFLEGQIDDAKAHELYEKFGGDPQFFQMMYDTRGNAPTPLEAVEMANRGIIPWMGQGAEVVSFEQAFLEGPWRNKWLEPFRQVAEYRPPARTITAMVRNGAINDATALRWFKDIGANTEVAAAMLAEAHHTKNQAAHQVAQSTVAQLYNERFIDRAKAAKMLGDLRYSPEDAAFILDLEDFKVAQAALVQARNRIHSLFVGHKIDQNAALNALNGLGIPADAVRHLMRTWSLERSSNVQVLTTGEIADAVYYSIMDWDTAVKQLVEKGFTQQDAETRIAIRLHGKPPPTPK